MNPESKIIIFTDGSSRGNPGPGGYAAIIAYSCELLAVRKDNEKTDGICISEIGGNGVHTTNNRMELQAAISALSFVSEKLKANSSKLTAFSDSSYVINGITKWVFGWQ